MVFGPANTGAARISFCSAQVGPLFREYRSREMCANFTRRIDRDAFGESSAAFSRLLGLLREVYLRMATEDGRIGNRNRDTGADESKTDGGLFRLLRSVEIVVHSLNDNWGSVTA